MQIPMCSLRLCDDNQIQSMNLTSNHFKICVHLRNLRIDAVLPLTICACPRSSVVDLDEFGDQWAPAPQERRPPGQMPGQVIS